MAPSYSRARFKASQNKNLHGEGDPDETGVDDLVKQTQKKSNDPLEEGED